MNSPFDNPTPPPSAEASAPTETPRQEGPDELTLLKQRAQIMGIQVPPNIKAETLKARIQEKVEADKRADQQKASAKPAASATEQSQPKPYPPHSEPTTGVSKEKTKQELARDLKAQYMKLVRVRVVCLDPSKADLKGEIITVANGILGKVSKFVPYGDECGEDGYHIPYILYLFLKEKRFYQVKKDSRGTPVRSVEMPEYAIEVLPQLTVAQLSALALRQKAAAGTTSSSSGSSPDEL